MVFQREKVMLDIMKGSEGQVGLSSRSSQEFTHQDPAQLLSLTAPCVMHCL